MINRTERHFRSSMRFTIGTLLFVMLTVGLSVGWWADSKRSQNEIFALQRQQREFESLHVEAIDCAHQIQSLETKIATFKREMRDNGRVVIAPPTHGGITMDLLQMIVFAQCEKSSWQLRELDIQGRMNELTKMEKPIPNATPRRNDIEILERELQLCTDLLATVEIQSNLDPTNTQKFTQQLDRQIARLEKAAKLRME